MSDQRKCRTKLSANTDEIHWNPNGMKWPSTMRRMLPGLPQRGHDRLSPMQPGKGMHTVALFNHIGGVGKTTIVVNIADAFIDLGYRVLLVDVDPQCTLTEFYLSGKQLSELVGESADFNGGTIWSAIKPVVAREKMRWLRSSQ